AQRVRQPVPLRDVLAPGEPPVAVDQGGRGGCAVGVEGEDVHLARQDGARGLERLARHVVRRAGPRGRVRRLVAHEAAVTRRLDPHEELLERDHAAARREPVGGLPGLDARGDVAVLNVDDLVAADVLDVTYRGAASPTSRTLSAARRRSPCPLSTGLITVTQPSAAARWHCSSNTWSRRRRSAPSAYIQPSSTPTHATGRPLVRTSASTSAADWPCS